MSGENMTIKQALEKTEDEIRDEDATGFSIQRKQIEAE